MSGAATISAVFAITTISRLRHNTPSAAHRREYGWSISETGLLMSVVMTRLRS